MPSLYHYFKWDSAVPSPHGALSSNVPSSAIESWHTTVIEQLIILQNRDRHHFQPLVHKSILQASLDQEHRCLCIDTVTPHAACTNKLLCHFCTFYLLKLEVGCKIVVIRENFNSQILHLLRKYSTTNISQHMVWQTNRDMNSRGTTYRLTS